MKSNTFIKHLELCGYATLYYVSIRNMCKDTYIYIYIIYSYIYIYIICSYIYIYISYIFIYIHMYDICLYLCVYIYTQYVALCSSQVCQMAPGSSTPTASPQGSGQAPQFSPWVWSSTSLILKVLVVLVVSKYKWMYGMYDECWWLLN